MATLSIIVGSVYGTAKAVANDIKADLEGNGHSVTVIEDAKAADLPTDDGSLVLICTSTTGAGELPGNLEPFFNELKSTPQPLTHIRYSVITLGDSSYGDTYLAGGKLMSELFDDLGATSVSPTLEIDSMEVMMPEEEAVPWAAELIANV